MVPTLVLSLGSNLQSLSLSTQPQSPWWAHQTFFSWEVLFSTNLCGEFYFSLWAPVAMFPSEVLKLSLNLLVRWFLSVQKYLLLHDPLPGDRSRPPNLLYLFYPYLSPYLILGRWAYCFLCLVYSASVQNVFCSSCSIYREIFYIFVGRGVISPS